MFALPDKWAGQACQKYVCMRTNWSSTWELLVRENRQNSFTLLWSLGVWGNLVILCEISVEVAMILHVYGHTLALSDWVDSTVEGMVDEFPELSSFCCVVFCFVFLYTGIPEITLKIWERRNLSNLDFYISWWPRSW